MTKMMPYLFLVAVWGLFAYELHTRMEERQASYMQNLQHDFSLEFRAIKQSYDILSAHVYDSQINKPAVTEIMYDAVMHTDAAQRRILHERLLEMLQPLYRDLKKRHIRQLHFHLPGAVSFLRFHRPDTYGDSLWDVRYSIKKVNETRQYVTGFEEGRVFNGFRHVYPLFHRGMFVGTVEISYSFSAIETLFLEIFPAVYSFILDEKPIARKVWKTELSNYARSDISEHYFYDVDTLEVIKNRTDSPIPFNTVEAINRKIAPTVDAELERYEAFCVPVTVERQGYIANFLPIRNVEAAHVAYFISYSADDTYFNFYHEFLTQVAGMTGLFGLIGLVIFLYRQILSGQKSRDILQQRVHTDPMTGIGNRQRFSAELDKTVETSQHCRTPFSIIFFDIDYFKEINDTHGHAVGDNALAELAALVQKTLRKSDCFARWGGEEFVILLPGTRADEALQLAEKLRLAVAGHSFSFGRMTCSFGVTQSQPDERKEDLMSRVDTALYAAKHDGRNRVHSVD